VEIKTACYLGLAFTPEHFELISITAVAHDLRADLDQFSRKLLSGYGSAVFHRPSPRRC